MYHPSNLSGSERLLVDVIACSFYGALLFVLGIIVNILKKRRSKVNGKRESINF
jgi:hypothetical protein